MTKLTNEQKTRFALICFNEMLENAMEHGEDHLTIELRFDEGGFPHIRRITDEEPKGPLTVEVSKLSVN